MALESVLSSIRDLPDEWKNSPVVGHGLRNSITLWVRPRVHLKECKHTDGSIHKLSHTGQGRRTQKHHKSSPLKEKGEQKQRLEQQHIMNRRKDIYTRFSKRQSS